MPTAIEWTDETWNPITGCSIKSPGCRGCYAMQLAATRLKNHPSRAGLTHEVNGHHVWTGEVRFNEGWLDQPIRWKRPRRIFVCAHGDLFHEDVPDAWIDRVFAVMALATQHSFQVLTKRPDRMLAYLSDPLRAGIVQSVVDNWESEDGCPFEGCAPWVIDPWPLNNVWAGVSVEDQPRADERREAFRDVPAAIKFVSYEPAIGPVDWTGWEFVDQIIGGGESGPDARPMHPDWQRYTRDWCEFKGIAYFFKQWGEWAPGENALGASTMTEQTADWFDGRWHFDSLTVRQSEELRDEFAPDLYRLGKKGAGRMLDGRLHDGMPA